MTYSKVGSEPAKVFQASSQMRRAPGGVGTVKEVFKCEEESGISNDRVMNPKSFQTNPCCAMLRKCEE